MSALPFLWYSYFSLTLSKVKIIAQGHIKDPRPLDCYPLCSMSINHPITEIKFLQNLTLKIQGQGHGWGHSLEWQSGSNFLSTHIPFVACKSVFSFLGYSFLKIWPWKSKVKVTPEGHIVGPTWWQHPIDSHLFCSMLIHPPPPPPPPPLFLKYSFFKIWPWKFQGQGHGRDQGSTSHRFTSLSLRVNQPSHPFDMAFSKFDHKYPRSLAHDVAQLQV